jgi:hypothetical protein
MCYFPLRYMFVHVGYYIPISPENNGLFPINNGLFPICINSYVELPYL